MLAGATPRKLAELEAYYEARRSEPAEGAHLRELSLRSLKHRINQLKEEIVLYEVREHAGMKG